MAVFTVSTFKANLKTQLEARSPALDGVTIFDAELSADEKVREYIVLGDWENVDGHHAMGNLYLEAFDVTCRIITRSVAANAAKVARDRAIALLTEVKQQLIDDDTASGAVLEAHMASSSGTERLWVDQGRECEIEFVINARETNE